MKKIGQITYELSEAEFHDIRHAIDDIASWFEDSEYEEEARKGLRTLINYFND